MFAKEPVGWQRWLAPFAIDLRTLALFRICLGLVILVDLFLRAQTLTAHYTDAGVWSRADASAALGQFGFSLHLLSGSAGFQIVLFIFSGLLAVLLILGYRTRWVAVLSWLMLVSVNNRNFLILQSSDTLMLALLFWSLFLPLGARWSVDAALDREPARTEKILSAASAALILQVLYVYFFGALLKIGGSWTVDKDAVYLALHFSAYASSLGVWVGEHLPLSVLRLLTNYTWYIELIGPLLVLLPFYTARIRAVIVPGLMLLHVGFALLLTVGIYPYLSLTSLLILIPSEFWEYLRKRFETPQRLGLKIYYDGPCVFCYKTCRLLRTFLLSHSTPIRPAVDHADIQTLLEEHHSWVVEDWRGVRHVRWQAMIIVLQASWLPKQVVWLFASKPFFSLGERFYSWVAKHRDRLGRLTSVLLPWRRISLSTPFLVSVLVGCLAIVVLVDNIAGLRQLDVDKPRFVKQVSQTLLLNQYWTMFAPNPGRNTVWLMAIGELSDGRRVNLYDLTFEAPAIERPVDGSGYFDGYRWRKYFNEGAVERKWSRLAAYYCRRWNATYPNTPVKRAVGYVIQETTLRARDATTQRWEYTTRELGRQPCR
ncbi:MAG: HTTM domain-containing protein [Pseudomonadota bacterium]